ncbi:hypothetical protein ACN26Y_29930 [Micromonospora sp. WMMD558]|uniref:hypothetical protein n=1 Tax=Micromonospora sp. WMMD558 TaxID=3403462 RepID=UPI003BF4AEF4
MKNSTRPPDKRVTHRTVLDLARFVDNGGIGLTTDAADYAIKSGERLYGDVEVHTGKAVLAEEGVIVRLSHALRNAATVTVVGETPMVIAQALAREIELRG